jgi:predicted NUDIX family NTP pyrophosphohydrolase
MRNESAGILLYRRSKEEIYVLLVHPGGPFWRRRDLGAWSIPKGLRLPTEDAEAAARREFAEELGRAVTGPLRPLGTVRQRGGKQVQAFAAEGAYPVEALRSNLFEIEWPPRSGRMQSFPEVDRAEWFTLAIAARKILPAQRVFLDRVRTLLMSNWEHKTA